MSSILKKTVKKFIKKISEMLLTWLTFLDLVWSTIFLDDNETKVYRTNDQEGANWKITRGGGQRGHISRGSDWENCQGGQKGKKIAQWGVAPFAP